ncbi:hypothetical protein B0H14DRAFT_2569662 [Mycena olivaceomarginata]|nr:hypothetical protein B0H14DRAFT_2569662 [Mycena olivaceomarginata]
MSDHKDHHYVKWPKFSSSCPSRVTESLAMAKVGKGKKKQPAGTKYDPSSLQCPDCLEMIHVGTGGPANLANHKPACPGRPKGRINKITDMFAVKPRAPLVPSTVIALTSTGSGSENDASFASSPLRESSLGADLTLVGSDDSSFLEYGVSTCPTGKVEQIPAHITGDPLADFAGNPADFFGLPEPEGRDRILNTLLERNFGSNSWRYSLGSVRNYLYHGPNGLDAFCDFLNISSGSVVSLSKAPSTLSYFWKRP